MTYGEKLLNENANINKFITDVVEYCKNYKKDIEISTLVTFFLTEIDEDKTKMKEGEKNESYKDNAQRN